MSSNGAFRPADCCRPLDTMDPGTAPRSRSSGFTPEQEGYLAGFMAGLRQQESRPFLGQNAEGQFTHQPAAAIKPEDDTVFGTPLDELSREEMIKYEQNGLDCWGAIERNAAEGVFAEGGDVFRFKFHGLFYVSPAQEAYMLRCRIPGCVLSSTQLRGLGRIASQWGGGYADITTRGNIQIPRDPARQDRQDPHYAC